MTVDMQAEGRETGAWTARVLGLDGLTIPSIDAAPLQKHMQAGGVSIVDVDWSREYLQGHIPGSWYGMRARLAAADLDRTASVPLLVLDGGTAAWRGTGFPMEHGATRMATSPDDIRLRAREQTENVEDAMRAYLSWEIDLAHRMAADDDQCFAILVP